MGSHEPRTVRGQLGGDVAKYDGDGDGVMDAVWIIPSAGSLDYPCLGGGASRNAGAGVFVDCQGTLSAQVGATGNFNHEVGHLRGLRDNYGKYDAVGSLSLMRVPVDVPRRLKSPPSSICLRPVRGA